MEPAQCLSFVLLLPLLASAANVYQATHDQHLIDEQDRLLHEMEASAPQTSDGFVRKDAIFEARLGALSGDFSHAFSSPSNESLCRLSVKAVASASVWAIGSHAPTFDESVKETPALRMVSPVVRVGVVDANGKQLLRPINAQIGFEFAPDQCDGDVRQCDLQCRSFSFTSRRWSASLSRPALTTGRLVCVVRQSGEMVALFRSDVDVVPRGSLRLQLPLRVPLAACTDDWSLALRRDISLASGVQMSRLSLLRVQELLPATSVLAVVDVRERSGNDQLSASHVLNEILRQKDSIDSALSNGNVTRTLARDQPLGWQVRCGAEYVDNFCDEENSETAYIKGKRVRVSLNLDGVDEQQFRNDVATASNVDVRRVSVLAYEDGPRNYTIVTFVVAFVNNSTMLRAQLGAGLQLNDDMMFVDDTILEKCADETFVEQGQKCPTSSSGFGMLYWTPVGALIFVVAAFLHKRRRREPKTLAREPKPNTRPKEPGPKRTQRAEAPAAATNEQKHVLRFLPQQQQMQGISPPPQFTKAVQLPMVQRSTLGPMLQMMPKKKPSF